jgi:hypothetical protein
MRRLPRTIATVALAACAILVLSGCGDPEREVGDRLPQLQKVVAAMRDKPEGLYSARSDVPAEVRPRGLLMVYVDGRGSCALEFISEPIDLNPAFVYVGCDTPDPEAVAREVCRKAGLTYRNAFKEPGWYRATGQ